MISKRNMFTKISPAPMPNRNTPRNSVSEIKLPDEDVKVFLRAPEDQQYGAERKITAKDHERARARDLEDFNKLPQCRIL